MNVPNFYSASNFQFSSILGTENIPCLIPILLCLLGFVFLWPAIWSTLESVPCAPGKMCVLLLLGGLFLQESTTVEPKLVALFQSSVFLGDLLSSCSIHLWTVLQFHPILQFSVGADWVSHTFNSVLTLPTWDVSGPQLGIGLQQTNLYRAPIHKSPGCYFCLCGVSQRFINLSLGLFEFARLAHRIQRNIYLHWPIYYKDHRRQCDEEST